MKKHVHIVSPGKKGHMKEKIMKKQSMRENPVVTSAMSVARAI